MQDSFMINNLLGDNNPHEFKKSMWSWIGDSNQASYSSGNIVFKTESLRTIWKDIHNAYVAIPISVVGSTAYTGVELVAFKASVLSFVFGVLIKMNGTTVSDNDNIMFINNIKLLIEKSIDWATINGPEIHYAKDANIATDANDGVRLKIIDPTANFVAATSAGAVTKALVALTSQNPTYNAGFFKRASFLRGNWNYENNDSIAPAATQSINWVGSGGLNASGGAIPASIGTTPSVSSYSLTITIPLKLVHSFFDSLNFPVINDSFEITIKTTNNSSCSFPPMTVPTGTYAPSITIRSQCRLYYRKLEFTPEDDLLIAEKFEKGFSKMLYYTNCDFFQPSNCLNNTSTSLTQLVTSSSINPIRLWVMMYPQGLLVLQVASNSPYVANIQALTSNVKINNTNMFEQNLETVNEHWEQLKEQLVYYDGFSDSNKSQVNYNDYLKHYSGYHVYDLARNKYKLVSPNTPNEIVWTCTKPSTAVDIVFLVERQIVMKLDFVKGGLIGIVS